MNECAAGKYFGLSDDPEWTEPCPLEGVTKLLVFIEGGEGEEAEKTEGWLCSHHTRLAVAGLTPDVASTSVNLMDGTGNDLCPPQSLN